MPEDAGKPIATKRGAALSSIKWERFCSAMELMIDFVPELGNGVICEFTHNNEIGVLDCKECNPFPGVRKYFHYDEDTLPIPDN